MSILNGRLTGLTLKINYNNTYNVHTTHTTDKEVFELLSAFADELATVFITSQAVVSNDVAPENAFKDTMSGIAVLVETADGEKCDRCWMYSVNTVSDGEGCVCERCKGVLGI